MPGLAARQGQKIDTTLNTVAPGTDFQGDMRRIPHYCPLNSYNHAAPVSFNSAFVMGIALNLLFDGVPDSIVADAVQRIVHVGMRAGGADDAFLQAATEQLHERVGISHVTLSVVRVPFTPGCDR